MNLNKSKGITGCGNLLISFEFFDWAPSIVDFADSLN